MMAVPMILLETLAWAWGDMLPKTWKALYGISPLSQAFLRVRSGKDPS